MASVVTDFIYLVCASDDWFTMTSRTLKLPFLIWPCLYVMNHPTASKSRGYILFLSRSKFVKLLCSSVVETIASFENNWIPWILGLVISIFTTFCLLGYWPCGQMAARSSSVIELVSVPEGETWLYVTIISHGKHFIIDFLRDEIHGRQVAANIFKIISMKGKFCMSNTEVAPPPPPPPPRDFN